MSEKIIISAFADEYATELCEQIAGMRKLGIKNIEIRGVDGENISVIPEDKIALIKKELDKNGISVSAIGSPIGKIKVNADIEAHFAMAERIFKTANVLGTKYVRMFSFYRSEQCSAEEYKESVYSYLEKLLSLAEKYGVILCHENEEAIYGESPEACLELLEQHALPCNEICIDIIRAYPLEQRHILGLIYARHGSTGQVPLAHCCELELVLLLKVEIMSNI